MISEELQEIIEQLNNQGKMDFLESTTKEQIAEFEKENKVKLPEKYKEWLLFSDGGECFIPGGIQLYGVDHKPIIDVNEDDRPDDNYIVIGALSMGDPVLCQKDGERISIYNHETGTIESDETYSDFFAFLKDLYDLLGAGG